MLNQIQCPRCQTPFTAEIHQVVDVGRDPQLKYELLNGTLNVFVCPNCGTSGQMATPLLYHDPENELFMVHVPMELNLPHEEQQRLIGQLVQEVMNQTPPEARRGYMLQPKEIISYQTFMEKILETEGVTPEMLARQRKQSELLQTLSGADRDLTEQLLQERADEIDETFFAMLHSLIEMAQQQGSNEQLLRLINLQARLYTETDIGRQLEARQTALRAFQQEARKEEVLTPELLLKHVIKNREDEATVSALISVGQQAFNYDFFRLLTERIEAAAREHNKEEATALRDLRQQLLEVQQEMQAASQRILDEAGETLERLLRAEDKEQALRENIARIDEPFMYVLSAMIAQAKQEGNEERRQRLQEIHNLILDEAERQVPPQIRFINKLVRAGSEEAQRQLLEENRDLITPELVQILDALGQEVAGSDDQSGIGDAIDRLKAMVQARV
ncbi:MAG: CpXC domain-containing protein [Anaerolineae bacterium]|nr:CpXC domain-containing protein [Anaerolineae bacterium]